MYCENPISIQIADRYADSLHQSLWDGFQSNFRVIDFMIITTLHQWLLYITGYPHYTNGYCILQDTHTTPIIRLDQHRAANESDVVLPKNIKFIALNQGEKCMGEKCGGKKWVSKDFRCIILEFFLLFPYLTLVGFVFNIKFWRTVR